MTKNIAWIITDNNISVRYDHQTHIVARTDALANKLIDALKNNRLDDIPNLVSAAKRIENFSKGNFVVKDGEILVNGIPAPTVLGNKIVRFANEGLPHQPLVAFAEKLQQNPSFRAVNELFQFLEKNDHPITETGNFIAYKKVRDDFKDVHSGTFDNSVGNTVEMPRNQVNEDATQTCSHGLHVANYDYATNFYGGGVMLEVEVNPADVVAVPIDYNQAKMRVCKYKVLGVVVQEHAPTVSLRYTSPPQPEVAEEEDDEFYDDSSDSDSYDYDDESSSEDTYPYEDELE